MYILCKLFDANFSWHNGMSLIETYNAVARAASQKLGERDWDEACSETLLQATGNRIPSPNMDAIQTYAHHDVFKL